MARTIREQPLRLLDPHPLRLRGDAHEGSSPALEHVDNALERRPLDVVRNQEPGAACEHTGKSYVACALAQQACRTGHRVLYRRMPRLIEELALAHADGTYTRLLGRLAKVDVLVLDDWGLAPLREQERRDMLEIFDDRHGARSTIVTSQLPVESWHDYVADPTIADALLDRIVHVAHRIKLKGPSRRKPVEA